MPMARQRCHHKDGLDDHRAIIPDFYPVIPNFYPVIPAKAGIQKAADALSAMRTIHPAPSLCPETGGARALSESGFAGL